MPAKSIFSSILVVLVATLSLAVSASVKDEISERTAPVGKLCMAGESCAAAAVQVASGPRSGEDIYKSKCVACHNTGAAGAPKIGDAGAWAPRVAKGVDTVYANAINGINGMPAKGLCMDCSDDEIKATVDYILENSK